jgi:hypothetical protein
MPDLALANSGGEEKGESIFNEFHQFVIPAKAGIFPTSMGFRLAPE